MITNPFQSIRIEYHILQSFPVTCLNRDDVGAPKSVLVGGVPRARVSSQCWKRQVRLTLHDFGVKLAMRTKKLEQLFHSACLEHGATEEQAAACAKPMADALSKDTLYFVSHVEVAALADYAKEKEFIAKDVAQGDGKGIDKTFYKVCKSLFKPAAQDGLDIALFGRMVASAPELNMEAASRFAHAISTHRVSNEIDYFTAVDDLELDHGGASHIGAVEYNSASYYRYVSLDLGQLWSNLHLGQQPEGALEELKIAIDAFTKALYLALPTARQNTQTGLCPWEFARVLVRKGQGVQASFEKPIVAKNASGYLAPSKESLTSWIDKQEKLSGSLFGKLGDFSFGEDENYSIDSLLADIKQTIAELA